MNRGVLIFAFNNETTDYVSMAAWSAARIQRHLDVPVCLVTDSWVNHDVFHTVITADSAHNGQRWMPDQDTAVSWKNFYRYRAMELSPFDHTLLLDADYVVASDVLSSLWTIQQDMVVMSKAHDVAGIGDFAQHNFFGRFAMPSAWATAICFRNTATARSVFEIMRRVQDNWQHYCYLYGCGRSRFRNDFALAIALHITYGNACKWPQVPWSMATVLPEYHMEQLGPDQFEVRYSMPNNMVKRLTINGVDFHAMNKRELEKIVAGGE